MPRDRKVQSPADRLIVALDVDSVDHAIGFVDALAGQVTRFKIGSQLFTASGPAAVEAVRKRGGEVFLDLKYHDIPNTVAGAAREAARRMAAESLRARPSSGVLKTSATSPRFMRSTTFGRWPSSTL